MGAACGRSSGVTSGVSCARKMSKHAMRDQLYAAWTASFHYLCPNVDHVLDCWDNCAGASLTPSCHRSTPSDPNFRCHRKELTVHRCNHISVMRAAGRAQWLSVCTRFDSVCRSQQTRTVDTKEALSQSWRLIRLRPGAWRRERSSRSDDQDSAETGHCR